jgi:Family of unknown function (DUF6603)
MAITVEALLSELGRALEPLEERLRGGEVRLLFAELGLPAPDAVLSAQPVADAVDTAADALADLPDALAELAAAAEADDTVRLVAAIARVTPLVEAVVRAIDAVGAQIDSVAQGAGPGRAEVEAFAAELPERLFGYAVAGYLDRARPVVGHLFTLFGVIEASPEPATAFAPAHVRRRLRLDRLPQLLDDPVAVLAELYGWGTPDLAWDLLLRRLATFLGRVSDFAFVQAGSPPVLWIAAIDVGPTGDPIPGLRAVLRVAGGEGLDVAVPIGETTALTARSEGALEVGAAIELLPPGDLRVVPPGVQTSGTLRLGVDAAHADDRPIVILGAPGGSRVQAGRLEVGAGADLAWDVARGDASGAFLAQAALKGGTVVLSLDGADGFLSALLPSGDVALDLELVLGWSSSAGLRFEGGVGLELDIPVDFDAGPVKLHLLHVALALEAGGVKLELSGSVSAGLGSFGLSIDRLGTTALLSFPDGGGRLGPAELSLAFKPPEGIGITLDAGVVRGGGFVGFYPERAEYAGVLDLAIGPISVKAIAILTTRLPGGGTGWALLLLVFSEFRAIQLGYGFTLNGVGGILGLQHGISSQALQDGLRTGALDSVLFPPDPVVNAPAVLGQLRLVFPVVPRALTIGPAFKLGWSTPPIITISLGLIVQVDDVLGTGRDQPQVSRVVLLGQLKVQLPPEIQVDAPELLKLLVDVVGSYELREQALAIDAQLRDSHVAGLPLTGSLVVRARFADRPTLILSVGGFHPRFTDLPPGLPELRRVGFELRREIVTVRVSGYAAITSNTLQFGAEAELKAEGAGFKVQATLGFDALCEPVFHFEIDFRVGAAISWHGRKLASIRVNGVLSGPGRWEVSGHASFSILWWDIGIDFEVEWGDLVTLALESVAVGAELVAALANRSNWSAQLPTGGSSLVTLRDAPGHDAVAAHPLGALSVTQTVVPLGIDIQRVGTARPSDGTRFDITRLEVADRVIDSPPPRDEHFARARYLDLDAEQRLSTPSFERFRAGVEISSADFIVPADQVGFEPAFETIYLGQPEDGGQFVVSPGILAAQARFGSASYSALRRDDRLLPTDLPTRIDVSEPLFVTVDRALAPDGAAPASYTEASERARRDGTLVAELAEIR